MLEMFDAVNVNAIPSTGVQAVAGYVGGNWPTYNSIVSKYPNAKHLSIAVNSSEDADTLDVEQYDATPSEAPAWYNRQIQRGLKRKPVFYANLSTMPAVVKALTDAGIGRDKYLVWTAHPNNLPHICPASHGAAYGLQTDADLTQWTWNALGGNLDESLVQDYVFGAPLPPPDPNHYNWFYKGPFPSKWGNLNERETVIQYDINRKTPLKHPLYLKKLRQELDFLARRVSFVAYEDTDTNGHPSWDKFRRGWRYQELSHRAQGKKVAV